MNSEEMLNFEFPFECEWVLFNERFIIYNN